MRHWFWPKQAKSYEGTFFIWRVLFLVGNLTKNAKKVLFAAAPDTAKVELHPVEVSVAGKVENNQEVVEDSLSMLPGFSQV